MTRQSMAINIGRGGNDCHRSANLRPGRRYQRELSARIHTAGDNRARR